MIDKCRTGDIKKRCGVKPGSKRDTQKNNRESVGYPPIEAAFLNSFEVYFKGCNYR